MEEKQQQLPRDKKTAKENKQNDAQAAKQQVPLINPAASSPPSASSSPSHEFSFTSSLHPPSSKIPENNKTKSPPQFAIDLSPADEIFFHGHLLPLHLLSNLPVYPRATADSFSTLPTKELVQDNNNNFSNNDNNNNKTSFTRPTDDDDQESSRLVLEGKGRGKSKSFSLFGNMPKCRTGEEEQKDYDIIQEKRKSKFEFVKRYVRLVMPFLSLKNVRRAGNSDQFLRQPPYSSYSGNLRVRSCKKAGWRGRRGEFSAPASMRASPTNSGLLVASGTVTPNKTTDSTMEELQAAIAAAIAHCKNSINATEDKIKVQQP